MTFAVCGSIAFIFRGTPHLRSKTSGFFHNYFFFEDEDNIQARFAYRG